MDFLISTAFASLPQYVPTSLDLNPAIEGSYEPASFKARRQALNITPVQLGSHLGISGEHVEMIESMSLGEEVSFLHNFTLSLLELGAF